jgi:hypothetical protein
MTEKRNRRKMMMTNVMMTKGKKNGNNRTK